MGAFESTVIINGRFPPKRPVRKTESGGGIDQLIPGTRLGQYLIVSRIPGGGMGVVYKAQDTALNRAVVLKFLPPQHAGNPAYIERFRNEAQAQARLNSPHVVAIYNMLELPDTVALVMEYLDGQTLAQRLQNHGPLSVEEALWVFDQALRGANDIHRAGIVHRDIKPSNIFITDDQRVKVMDFGIAKLMDVGGASSANALMGTLLYISPEQINGRQIDYRADIYTLGVSLYEAVTGALPFRRKSDYALMHAHVQENPPRPRNVRRRVPRTLERIILKAIEKDPHRRFQTVVDFHQVLMSLATDNKLGTVPVGRSPLHPALPGGGDLLRRRLLRGARVDVLLVAIACAFVLTLGAYPLLNRAPSDHDTGATAHKTAPAGDRYAVLRKIWGD